jgi:hypothetical protein
VVVGTFLSSFQGISAIIRNFTNARLESRVARSNSLFAAQQRKANEKQLFTRVQPTLLPPPPVPLNSNRKEDFNGKVVYFWSSLSNQQKLTLV